ncbi:efflux RND transporter periplasmic adaptor subunit [Fuerstiella marisgermanici]|uniref:Efflux transporter, RND family, MFP subunit n=1 Tax=Fuerstiella marisgermanici TaxID=1891926 RepID=A0A1P8WQV2_9PLAN|nr:HlyD family efflux transporter periplasmic adaptor subunit [Fuerstiella marisgermanici]APZ96443.1 efflux transporter, RND family, MFP subunit [Fuerstiella marisgermanici]
MRFPKSLRLLSGVAFAAIVVGVVFFTRDRWMTIFSLPEPESHAADSPPPVEEPKVLKLSPQARKNLELVSKPARPQTYWRTIQVPGEIVDRPGQSDRGVTSPAVGVVSEVHAFPGDTVRPGDRLFTLRLFSEYLQSTQKELFSSTKESQIAQEQLARLSPLADKGGISKTKIIDLENELRRQQAVIQAHRQDLLTRGLNPQQVDQVANGQFVSTVDVVTPSRIKEREKLVSIRQASFREGQTDADGFAFEVQELNAELGQQVQAGQLLITLANHSSLYLEGHAFKREAPYLEKAAQNGWEISVEFAEDEPENWPELDQSFEIRYLSNSIDQNSRTFDFFIPLTNQSRSYEKSGETFVVWRFRPGQRIRLHVPVEEMTDVLVLPSAAIVREGPEAYVFQQNGDLFNRIPVQVLHEDRRNIVVANDGSVTPGLFLAQSAAASLNRVLKAQAASGMRADVHVHADGTVHASH